MSRRTPSFERKIGAVLSYGEIAGRILISLLYTPVMLHVLGRPEYGLYQTAVSTISMLCVLELGFGGSYFRSFTRYRQNGEEKRIDSLNGMFVAFYAVISLIVLLCGVYLAFHLDLVFDAGLTEGEYRKARTLILVAGVNYALDLLFCAPNTYVAVHERFIFSKGIVLLKTLTGPVIELPLLLCGFGSIGLAGAKLALSLVVGLLKVYYSVRRLNFRVSFRNWEPGLFKSSFLFSSLIALIIISNQINNNLDNLLLTRFRGPAETAVNALGTSFYTYYESFSAAISGVFFARAYQLVAEFQQDSAQQRRALTHLITKIGRVQFLLLALVCSGFVIFGQDFICLWAGPEYKMSYWVSVFRLLPATIPLIQNTGVEVMRAENRHHYQAYIYFSMTLLNAVLTVFICQVYGAPGAAFATGVTTLAAQGVMMNIVYHRRGNIDVLFFWKNIFRQLLGIAVPFAAALWVKQFFVMDSWLKLGVCGIIYSCAYAAFAWRFSMNRDERELAGSVLRKLRLSKGR